MDFDQLPENTKKTNLAAAERIARILALVGLRIVPQGTVATTNIAAPRHVLDAHIEQLAEAEHEGWMEQKRRCGWVYGAARDDSAKRHPSMVPYNELSPGEKDKDRDSVLRYPDLLRACGFEIVAIPAAPPLPSTKK